MNIGYLVSGNLGLVTLQKLSKKFPPAFVITDKGSEEIIMLCESFSWPCFSGKPAGERFSSFKNQLPIPNMIVSINFLFLITQEIIEWSELNPINIHGSLLPRYRGRAPHIWSIINGEVNSGLTIHLIDQGCDTGPILYQEKIPISPTTTGGDLLEEFKERYPIVLERIMSAYLENLIVPIPQVESEATYFGKRTPEDGLINWSWNFVTLHNWIRALTSPYPGAFSYLESSKIKILEIKKSTTDPQLFQNFEVGSVVALGKNSFSVKGADCIVEVVKFELTEGPQATQIRPGAVLTANPTSNN